MTGLGLLYAARQLRISRKIARGEFLLHLYELVQEHNCVHAALTDHGRWANKMGGPRSDEEWFSVDRYMGLLESLQVLVEDGFLDARTVDRQYGHRIAAIAGNDVIRQRNLVDQAYRWKDFIALWRLLEKEDSYCAIQDNEGDGKRWSSTMRMKVAVNCPDDEALIQDIIDAASAAGGGKIGNYSRVALVLRGYETWKSEPGATPHTGEVGKVSKEPSVRIEMQCEEEDVGSVMRAIRDLHPYEEPVIEVIRLESVG